MSEVAKKTSPNYTDGNCFQHFSTKVELKTEKLSYTSVDAGWKCNQVLDNLAIEAKK